jgi:hypothetical protein
MFTCRRREEGLDWFRVAFGVGAKGRVLRENVCYVRSHFNSLKPEVLLNNIYKFSFTSKKAPLLNCRYQLLTVVCGNNHCLRW